MRSLRLVLAKNFETVQEQRREGSDLTSLTFELLRNTKRKDHAAKDRRSR